MRRGGEAASVDAVQEDRRERQDGQRGADHEHRLREPFLYYGLLCVACVVFTCLHV